MELTSLRSAASDLGTKATDKPLTRESDDSVSDGFADAPAVSWHRVLSVLATISVAAAACESWSAVPFTWGVSLLVPIAVVGGIILATAALAVKTERAQSRVDWLIVVQALLTLAAIAAATIYLDPGYRSDEAALQQGAAALLLHGHDPYGANLIASFTRYRLPANWGTYTLSGGEATRYSYPALPLLVAALAQLVTGGHQSAPIADIAILALTLIGMFKLLQPRLRPIAVIALVPMPMLFGMAWAGLNEVAVMPLLMLVAWRWTSVGRGGRLSRLQIGQAIVLGLAIATQQLAWFVAPFFILGVFLLRRRDQGARRGLRIVATYVAWAAGTFIVINLPFIAWGPAQWLAGVTEPLRQKSLPFGQGLVDWTMFLRWGGGMLSAYNYAGFLLLAGLLALYALNFERLARATFALPVLALLVSARPLDAYFVPLIAPIIISIATLETGSLRQATAWWQPLRRGLRRLLNVACVVPAVVCLALALLVPAPLVMSLVNSLSAGGPIPGVWWMQVKVYNRSSHTLTPRFVTNQDGSSSDFWHILRGPKALKPHATAQYVLSAPNPAAMFGSSTPFALTAVTSSPETFSSTGRISAEPWATDLEPAYFNNILDPGQSITFTVQLRTATGFSVHKAGVPVTLLQSIYKPWGDVKPMATINGGPVGAKSGRTFTNSRGQAIFRVKNLYTEGQPIYFQAEITPVGHPLYAHSNIVSVTWGRRAGGRPFSGH
jgi:uncharacterized membrane protein